MHLDSGSNFVAGVLGGVLIAVATSTMLLLLGQLSGLSSSICALVSTPTLFDRQTFSKMSFLFGLFLTGLFVHARYPSVLGSYDNLNVFALLLGGLLVGVGSRLGGGCSSGHSIQGLPRLSPRSLVAVLTFLSSGAVVAYAYRAYIARILPHMGAKWSASLPMALVPVVAVFVISRVITAFRSRSHMPPTTTTTAPAATTTGPGFLVTIANCAISLLCGAVFGAGLAISRLTDPRRVFAFLDFTRASGWDCTFVGVMCGVLLVNVLVYIAVRMFLPAAHAPLSLSAAGDRTSTYTSVLKLWTDKPNMHIDSRLIAGAALFGAGWGLTGLCAGPAVMDSAAGGAVAQAFMPAMLTGMLMHEMMFVSKQAKNVAKKQ